jgi:hypothetical protein
VAVIACPNCGGKTPATAVGCVHCGALAPNCWKCAGTGTCGKCRGAYPAVAGCGKCNRTGKCPTCEGRKRAWTGVGPKKGP